MTHPLILVWFIILGAIMMFLIGWQSHNRYIQTITQQASYIKPQYAVGDYIQKQGSIKWPYGFGMLLFTSSDGEERIIKSTITNITHLTGEVTIQGTILWYNGIVPVVNVYHYQSQWSSYGSQFRYDDINGVVIRPGYDATFATSWDLITITDPVVNKIVLKIRSFPCIPWSGQLSDECRIETSTLPNFISSYRHKFIQWEDVWYVFGDNIWYRIWASDEYYVNLLSQYFDLMNTRLMSDLVRKELKTKCVGPQTNVVEYINHRTREQNGNTFVIVRWLNSNKKLAVCQLKLITTNHMVGFEGITTIPVEE